ncbi:hypothetical protein DLAC_01809 [Tieghemostelium lacteum]|uniref:Uncharacterized protein n=1 Tax=Tieghemostelium lacteum TaxID=361077 RepID=A0A152A6Q3_TIELA|nr:hypothetical protein DLAC_01809 [Tieghemostelium lacteum]|eukprot:KYR01795.1 hypothetical protein DLAC_01809 [Tieghemostelium lacteum]
MEGNNKLQEDLFFRIFRNDLLRKKILRYLQINEISCDVLEFSENDIVSYRWDDISMKPNWIVDNGYYSLLVEKYELDEKFKPTKYSVYQLIKKCNNVQFLKIVHQKNPNLLASAVKYKKESEYLLLDELPKQNICNEVIEFLLTIDQLRNEYTIQGLKNALCSGKTQLSKKYYQLLKSEARKERNSLLEILFRFCDWPTTEFYLQELGFRDDPIPMDRNYQLECILENNQYCHEIFPKFGPWNDIITQSYCFDRFCISSTSFDRFDRLFKENGIQIYCTSMANENAVCSDDLPFLIRLNSRFSIDFTMDAIKNALSFSGPDLVIWMFQQNPPLLKLLRLHYKSLINGALVVGNLPTCKQLLKSYCIQFFKEDSDILFDEYNIHPLRCICFQGDLEFLELIFDNQLEKNTKTYLYGTFPENINNYLKIDYGTGVAIRKSYYFDDIYDDGGIEQVSKLISSNKCSDELKSLIETVHSISLGSLLNLFELDQDISLTLNLVLNHLDKLKIRNIRITSFQSFKRLHQLSLSIPSIKILETDGSLEITCQGNQKAELYLYLLVDRQHSPIEILQYFVTHKFKYTNQYLDLSFLIHFNRERDHESIQLILDSQVEKIVSHWEFTSNTLLLKLFLRKYDSVSISQFLMEWSEFKKGKQIHLSSISSICRDYKRLKEFNRHVDINKTCSNLFSGYQDQQDDPNLKIISYICRNQLNIPYVPNYILQSSLIQTSNIDVLIELSHFQYAQKVYNLTILDKFNIEYWKYLVNLIQPTKYNSTILKKLKEFLSSSYKGTENVDNSIINQWSDSIIQSPTFKRKFLFLLTKFLVKMYDSSLNLNYSILANVDSDIWLDFKYLDLFKIRVELDEDKPIVNYTDLKNYVHHRIEFNPQKLFNDYDCIPCFFEYALTDLVNKKKIAY